MRACGIYSFFLSFFFSPFSFFSLFLFFPLFFFFFSFFLFSFCFVFPSVLVFVFLNSQTKAPFLAFQPLNTTRWCSGIHHHHHHVTTRQEETTSGEKSVVGSGVLGDEIRLAMKLFGLWLAKYAAAPAPSRSFPLSIPLFPAINWFSLVSSLTPPTPQPLTYPRSSSFKDIP